MFWLGIVHPQDTILTPPDAYPGAGIILSLGLFHESRKAGEG